MPLLRTPGQKSNVFNKLRDKAGRKGKETEVKKYRVEKTDSAEVPN